MSDFISLPASILSHIAQHISSVGQKVSLLAIDMQILCVTKHFPFIQMFRVRDQIADHSARSSS
jgi:hypothetical protein